MNIQSLPKGTVPAGFLLLLCLTLSCSRTPGDDGEAYRESIERWHRQRIASLKEDDSWLSLAGLYSLHQGTQTFGADSTNDLVFPGDKAPGRIGTITLAGDSLLLDADPQTVLEVDGNSVRGAEAGLLSDRDPDGPTVMARGSLKWYVIERGGDYFVRLKDTQHPRLSDFEGIERFPVSPEWKVEAEFHAYEEPREITIPNVLGQQIQSPLYGTLRFRIDGNSYELAPLGSPDDDSFFIIFGDRTNGESTYGGGRFLYAETPGENGVTHLDFNKAYNPPCVFNDFATCPLPPVQNRLSIAVTAGEKNYGPGASH